MRGRASTTPKGVALLRGLAARDPRFGVHDPTAEKQLGGAWRLAVGALARVPVPVVRWASAGLFDHVGLRTRAIDEALLRALSRGAEQLVILGAGFDGRADRIAALRRTRVFEVDHPATQADKRGALGELGRVFVSVDFEREDLAARLADEGHDAEVPTAWIWEGVTPYLERRAVEASLVAVGARSAPRSTLLMTYVTPASVDRLREIVGVFELCLRAVGEPLRSRLETGDAHALAAAQGFRVASDEGSDDWARRWLELQRPPVVGVTERLLEAVRPGLAA